MNGADAYHAMKFLRLLLPWRQGEDDQLNPSVYPSMTGATKQDIKRKMRQNQDFPSLSLGDLHNHIRQL